MISSTVKWETVFNTFYLKKLQNPHYFNLRFILQKVKNVTIENYLVGLHGQEQLESGF